MTAYGQKRTFGIPTQLDYSFREHLLFIGSSNINIASRNKGGVKCKNCRNYSAHL